LVLVSAIPAIVVFLWFRLSRFPVSAGVFLVSFFAGVSSVLVALFLHLLAGNVIGIFSPITNPRTELLVISFFRDAFPEELSRLAFLIPLFLVFRRFNPAGWIVGRSTGGADRPSAETMGRASGFVAGLGFGILEGAIYGAADPFNALLRVFTSTLLHAACGSRVGSSIMIFREKPALGVFQFLSAVAIHGIYNFMIYSPGRVSYFVAIFVVFSALASCLKTIDTGMRAEDNGTY